MRSNIHEPVTTARRRPRRPAVSKRLSHRCVSAMVVILFVYSPGWERPVRAQNEPAAGLAAAHAIEQAFIDAIDRAESSVVSIARIRTSEPTPFQDHRNPLDIELGRGTLDSEIQRPEHPDYLPSEFGTGIIVAPEESPGQRFVVTNYHVIKGGPVVGGSRRGNKVDLYVRLTGGRGCYAKILAGDPRSDLAVLTLDFGQLQLRPEDLEPMTPGDASNLRKGQLVLALGNPYAIARDGSASASWGIVSNIARRPAPPAAADTQELLDRQTMQDFGTLLQLDTRLNLGTSGGALLDLKGELIGITTSLAAIEGYEKSVGFAVPYDEATRRVVEDLMQGFEVEYGFLGVSPSERTVGEVRRQFSNMTADVLQRLFSYGEGRDRVVVAERVAPNSPARKAGMQENDIVLSVNDKPVYDQYDLMLYVGQLAPETNARLMVWRPHLQNMVPLNVDLGKWPVRKDEEIIATRDRYPAWRGLKVDFPTGRDRYFAFPEGIPQAVVVTNVDPRSSAAVAELKPGDFIASVNGTAVETPGEFHQAVEGSTGAMTLELHDGRQVRVRP